MVAILIQSNKKINLQLKKEQRQEQQLKQFKSELHKHDAAK